MKLRILGCGTSSGVPRIGNDWGDCDPSEPRNRRTRASLLVTSGDQRLLIDCGPDFREQMLSAGELALDRVIITHDHADHCHGLDDLRQVAQAIGRPVPVHARRETLDRIQARFDYGFQQLRFYQPIMSGHVVEDEFQFGDATVRVVDQPHGGITSLGLRLDEGGKSAAYAIDFHDLTDDMAKLYQGVDWWVCDCLRRQPHPTHAHLDAVVGWARDLGVGQLLLTHLDKSMDYRGLAAELPDWAAPAFDGQEISW